VVEAMTDIQELRALHEVNCAAYNPFAGPEGGGGACDCRFPALLDRLEQAEAEVEKLKATPMRTGCDECLEERDRILLANYELQGAKMRLEARNARLERVAEAAREVNSKLKIMDFANGVKSWPEQTELSNALAALNEPGTVV
jgi:hypothetical protein